MWKTKRCIGFGCRLQLLLLQFFSLTTGYVRKASLVLARFFKKSNYVELRDAASNAVLYVSLSDPYWSRLVVDKDYEPEIRTVLDIAQRRGKFFFLDCGANIGYWSSLAASCAKVVAVEPNPELLTMLKKHALINKFEVINKAIWSQGNQKLQLSWNSQRHGSASVCSKQNVGEAIQIFPVETVSLDQLWHDFGHNLPVVVKLDVEGAEIQAINGGEQVFLDGLIIYEDHGNDVECIVTKFLLAKRFIVRWIEDPTWPQIYNVNTLRKLKTKKTKGYNLIAYRQESTWSEYLNAPDSLSVKII